MSYRDFEEFLDAGKAKTGPAAYRSFEDFLDEKPSGSTAGKPGFADFEEFLDAPAKPARKQYSAPVISPNPEHDDLYDAPGDGPLNVSQTAKLIGGQVVDAATHHLPAAVAAGVEGAGYMRDSNWTDNAGIATDFQQAGMDISEEKYSVNPVIETLVQRGREKEKEGSTPDDTNIGTAIPGVSKQDVQSLGPSLGQSAGSMGAALFGGLPALALSTGSMQRTSANRFLRDMAQTLQGEHKQRTGEDMPESLLKEKLSQVVGKANESGWWEAVPEQIGDIAAAQILKAPFVGWMAKTFGRNVVTKVLSKWTGMQIPELATETVTHMGQHNAEVQARQELGVARPGDRGRNWTSFEDWLDSFDEIAAPTMLQTTLFGMGGSVVNNAPRVVDSVQASIDPKGYAARQFARELENTDIADSHEVSRNVTHEDLANVPDPARERPDMMVPGQRTGEQVNQEEWQQRNDPEELKAFADWLDQGNEAATEDIASSIPDSGISKNTIAPDPQKIRNEAVPVLPEAVPETVQLNSTENGTGTVEDDYLSRLFDSVRNGETAIDGNNVTLLEVAKILKENEAQVDSPEQLAELAHSLSQNTEGRIGQDFQEGVIRTINDYIASQGDESIDASDSEAGGIAEFSGRGQNEASTGINWRVANDQRHAGRVASIIRKSKPGYPEYRYTIVEPGGSDPVLSQLPEGQAVRSDDTAGKGRGGKKHAGLPERVKALETALGRKVVFARREGDSFGGYQGFVITSDPGTIYINPDASVSIESIFGHEYYESLKLRSPVLHKWFTEQAEQYLIDEQFREYGQQMIRDGYRGTEHSEFMKEMLADFAGDALNDPAFRERLFRQDENKFKALIRGFIQYLNRILDRLRGKRQATSGLTSNQGFGTDKLFTDVEKMRDALIQVFRAAEKGEVSHTRIDDAVFSLKADGPAKKRKLNLPASFSENNTIDLSRIPSSGRKPVPLKKRPAAFDVPDAGAKDTFIRDWIDEKIDIKRVQQDMEARGAVIGEDADVLLASELLPRITDNRMKAFAQDQVRPLLAEIDALRRQNRMKRKEAMEAASQYLIATHAHERNAEMKRRNISMEDNESLSSMTDAEADTILKRWKGNPHMQTIRRIASDITVMERQLWVESGIESAGTTRSWEDMYQNYVPLPRKVQKSQKKKGKGGRYRQSQHAVGSHLEAENVVAALVYNGENAIKQYQRAKVDQALLNLVRQNPNPDFWQIDPAPERKRKFNPDTGLVEWQHKPHFKFADNVLPVKENGKEYLITFNDRNPRAMEIASVMKGSGVTQPYFVIRALGAGTRYMSQWITTRNPYFMYRNFQRDVQHALVNIENTPIKGKQAQMTANILPAMRGMWMAERTTGRPGNRLYEYAMEFKRNGGETGFSSNFENIEARLKDLDGELKKVSRPDYSPVALLNRLVKLIDDYNSVIENGVRLSAYITARENGISPARAASIAANVTVNFNRRGKRTRSLSPFFMFMNANIQGNVRTYETFRDSPRARYVILPAMIAYGFISSMAVRMIMGTDDDTGEDRYDLISEFIRDRNHIIPINDSGDFLKVPIAQGFDSIISIGRLAADFLFSKENISLMDSSAKFAANMFDSMNPIGSSGSLLQMLSPTVLKPITMVLENKRHDGHPVRRPQFQQGYEKPAYTQAFRTTPKIWVEMSQFLSDITGGDDVMPGDINIAPESLRLLVTSYFMPGVSSEIDRSIDSGIRAAKSETLDPNQVPVLNMAWGRSPAEKSKVSAFYAGMNKRRQIVGEIRQYQQRDDWENERKGYKRLGDGDVNEGAKRYDQFIQVEKEMLKLNRERRELENFEFSADPVKAASQRKAQQELLMENEAVRNAVIAGALRGR